MTEVQLKSRVGLFLIISHFSIILFIVILYLFNGFLFEEMTTAIALIIPMFSWGRDLILILIWNST